MDTQSTYNSLCSVLHDLVETPLFVIFMSTTSHSRRLAPPAKGDSSMRIVKSHKVGGLIQHPPYVAFPFDIYKDESIIIENTMTLEDTCHPLFQCRFGRSL